MRDPKRIPVLLDKIKGYWEEHPDLRLGQLLHNALPMEATMKDFRVIEDEKLGELLDEFHEGFLKFAEFQKENKIHKTTKPIPKLKIGDFIEVTCTNRDVRNTFYWRSELGEVWSIIHIGEKRDPHPEYDDYPIIYVYWLRSNTSGKEVTELIINIDDVLGGNNLKKVEEENSGK